MESWRVIIFVCLLTVLVAIISLKLSNLAKWSERFFIIELSSSIWCLNYFIGHLTSLWINLQLHNNSWSPSIINTTHGHNTWCASPTRLKTFPVHLEYMVRKQKAHYYLYPFLVHWSWIANPIQFDSVIFLSTEIIEWTILWKNHK